MPLWHLERVRGRGDAEVLRLAGLQHGHVLRSQLLEAGVGRGALTHRLRKGWLHEAFPSVYRIAGAGEDPLGPIMAAALSLRGAAVVAGVTAAGVWQLLDTTQRQAQKAPVEVLLVARSARPRAGIKIHRVKELAGRDIRWRSGIPVTAPARTLLDLAGTMDDLELEAALSAAFRKNLVRRSQLTDAITRNPQAKGIGRLRRLLEQNESLRDTRSRYERALLKLLRAAELPLPITNIRIGGKLVDGVWPDLKLAYEFDGWLYHRGKFESDRLRDQQMLIAGHQVFRISGRQIDLTPYALIARIASMITARRLAVEHEPRVR